MPKRSNQEVNERFLAKRRAEEVCDIASLDKVHSTRYALSSPHDCSSPSPADNPIFLGEQNMLPSDDSLFKENKTHNLLTKAYIKVEINFI